MDINNKQIDKQSRAYEHLFIIENLLRVAMHNVMVRAVGTDYFNEETFPEYVYKEINPDSIINIVKSAKEKKALEKPYKLAMGYNYPYFWYLDYMILISVIDIFWDDYFVELLKKPKIKKDILYRLKSVSHIRNAVSHNRYISENDISELKTLNSILMESINDFLIFNFNDLALNPLDDLKEISKNQIADLISAIDKKLIINRSKLRSLKSSFSALIPFFKENEILSTFDEIITIIDQYNKLPRKPGRADELNLFLEESKLIVKIKCLLNLIGV